MVELQDIYRYFLESPTLNGCLVLDGNNFSGVLLKKDLELALREQDHFITPKIIHPEVEQIEKLIFSDQPNLKLKIPYISPLGKVLGFILYSEFVGEFFTEDYRNKLSFTEIFDFMEHPTLILNQFKRILYLNKSAEDLLSQKAFGLKISKALLGFDLSNHGESVIASRGTEQWELIISKSPTPFAEYTIYQFKKNTPY